jgi:hypothetical protein
MPPVSSPDGRALLVVSAIATLVGVTLFILANRIAKPFVDSLAGASSPPSIEMRLRLAANALREARDVMTTVERELQARQARLETLSAEYKQAEELAAVNRDAAAALRMELLHVVKGESRRTFWLTIAAGIPVAVAGAVIAAYLLGLASSH